MDPESKRDLMRLKTDVNKNFIKKTFPDIRLN